MLRGVAEHVLPAGAAGAELAAIARGWAELLGDPVDLDAYAAARGGVLFALSARMLGATDVATARAGEMWALADLARHSGRPEEQAAALQSARERIDAVKWPRALRPLGMLAMLAKRDVERGPNSFERPGSSGRMLRMLRHRLTGL